MQQQIDITLELDQLDVIFDKIFNKMQPDYTLTDYTFIFMPGTSHVKGVKLSGLKEVEFDIKEIL